MFNFKLKIFILMIVFVTSSAVETLAQTSLIDSLKLALKNAKHDTTRCAILKKMIDAESDEAVWPSYNDEIKKISEKNLKRTSSTDPLHNFYLRSLAGAITEIGYLFKKQGDIPAALDYYNKSLKLYETAGDKPGMARSFNHLGGVYSFQGDFVKAKEYYLKSLKIYEQMADKKGLAVSLDNMGNAYYDECDWHNAVQYLIKALKIYEESGNKKEAANLLNNIAYILQNQGDITKALGMYIRGLKIQEEIGDKSGIANSLTNIGCVYLNQGETEITFDYFNQSLKIYEELGDKYSIARTLNNIGSIYQKNGDPKVTTSKEEAMKAGMPKALNYFERSLKIQEDIGNKSGAASSLNNIGTVFSFQGDFSGALRNHTRSLSIRQAINDKPGMASSLNNIGDIYFDKKDFTRAKDFCEKSLALSKELGYPHDIRNAALSLNLIYKVTGNHKLALENYELYIKMGDSLNNESIRKASIKNQLKYEYEKQAAADSVSHAKESEIKNVQLQKQTAEIKAKKNQQYVLFGGLGLVIIFAGFMFNRFRVTQKQKGIIELQKFEVEKQKHLVDEKQKEVMDSIRYAQRIQRAQLPSEKKIIKSLERLMKS